MDARHRTLFITHRGLRHQQAALAGAPPELEITLRRSPSKDEIIALLPGREFLISERTGDIDADVIRAGQDLKLIQRLGSQTYDIDLAAARAAGIPVCCLPVRGCIMVAEHMMMQLLALAKRVREMMDVAQAAGNWGQKSRRCDEDTFAYNWSQRQGIRGLWEATVGILGMGEIGLELARRLRGWECTVLYNKRRPMPALAEQELGVRFAPVDELLAHSDYVCVLLPFLPETEQSLDAGFLARMKPGACLVSCGGSGVVDEHALAAALRSGHLGGAALDTFTWEPIRPDNPLLSLALGTTSQQPQANGVGYNIILTPHTAAGSGAARDDARSDDYTNIRRVLNGQELIYRVA